MKYLVLILDGATDEPVPALAGQTPLQAACTPHLDHLAHHGRCGRLKTAHPDLPVESLACIMGMLGYDPGVYYPAGRASFEALARGIALKDGDMALRCNIVFVSENGRALQDFNAGMISDAQARHMLEQIPVPHPGWELHAGQSYRNLLVIRSAGLPATAIVCAPPHMHHGEPVEGLLPHAATPRAQILAMELAQFMLGSIPCLASSPPSPNGKTPMLWLWSPSDIPHMPPFDTVHGKRGAVVAGLDFIRGLARAVSMDAPLIPGATGYADTDYAAKAGAAITALKNHDVVFVHVNAPDEAGHQRDGRGKTAALERMDRLLLGPLLVHLHTQHAHGFRLAVTVDHMTRCLDGHHMNVPTPYLLFPGQMTPTGGRFTESRVEHSPALSSLLFMRELLA